MIPTRHPHVLPPDDQGAAPTRGTTRSFFVDVAFDPDGALLAVKVEEHGPEKCADDERALAKLVWDYFAGNLAVDVARRIRTKYGEKA